MKNSPMGYFTDADPDQDVVVSTRVRLSRNLANHPFPGKMTSQEEAAVQGEIIGAFSETPSLGAFSAIQLEKLSPTERRILVERGIISENYSIEPFRCVVIRDDERCFAVMNEIEHLRLFSICGGYDPKRLHEELSLIDRGLEGRLDFAAAIDVGYIETKLENMGTGLRLSALMHLPGLMMTGYAEKTLRHALEMGLIAKGFFSETEQSRGAFYILANQYSFASSEDGLISFFSTEINQIVRLERIAREEIMNKRRINLEDRVYRSCAILKHCRKVTMEEALEHLGNLRLGISVGWVSGLTVSEVSAVLNRVGAAHVQFLTGNQDEPADSGELEAVRAKLIHEIMEKAEF
jgi:protein arginine kinase